MAGQIQSSHPKSFGWWGLIAVAAFCFIWSAMMRPTVSTSELERRELLLAERGPLLVEREHIDLGSIGPRDKPKAIFNLRNISADNVVIVRTIASCSCLSTDFEGGVFAPGEQITIPVEINAEKIVYSKLQQSISLIARIENDDTDKVYQLLVTGYIKRADLFAALPGALDFGNVIPGVTVSQTILIRADNGILEALPRHIQLNYAEDTKYEFSYDRLTRLVTEVPLEISLTIPHDAAYQDSVVSELQLTGKGSRPLSMMIPYSLAVVGAITIEPEQMFGVFSATGQMITLKARVRSTSGLPVHIKSIDADIPLTWTHTQNSDGAMDKSVSEIVLDLQEEDFDIAQSQATIRIVCDEPVGTITIPIVLLNTSLSSDIQKKADSSLQRE